MDISYHFDPDQILDQSADSGKNNSKHLSRRCPCKSPCTQHLLSIHEYGTTNLQTHDLDCPPGAFITELCGNRFVRVSDRFETFGLRSISLTCSDGSRVDPFGIGTGERCLSKPTGFKQIGIGHGSHIDRIRDTTLPDGDDPPNYIGNLGGDIHNLDVSSTTQRLAGVGIGYKPDDALAFYVKFTFMDFAVDDGVCLDPNLFRRTYDMESIGSEQPVRVSTEVAVRSTKRHLSRFSRRALFVVELALTFLKFVCNTLQITPSKAINLGGNCQGKPFLGGDR